MILSDLSVRRPVLASVISLVIVVLGVVGYSRLGVRELPDIDAPTVSIETSYPGAAASVVEPFQGATFIIRSRRRHV